MELQAPQKALSERAATEVPSKLVKSAREFEAILLQSWLEKMNQSFVGSEESQDPAHDTVSSLGTQAIATALVARGGIGMAAMLLQKLQPGSAADTVGPVSDSAVKAKVDVSR